MIDALIYGMIPSVKMEKRLTAPPENMSISPNRVPDCAAKRADNAWVSMPGVGMYTPIR